MFRKILQFVSRVDIFVYLLLWLIFLLVIGTISQKNIGLYLAQQKYFSSFILLLGDFLPVPGTRLVMVIISLSLLAKILLEKWKIERLGTIIIHLAILLLFLGGFVTAISSYEGNMVIEEGKASNYISDYYKMELVITDISESKEIVFDENYFLKKQNIIIDEGIDFSFLVKKYYTNCSIIEREKQPNSELYHGMLKKFKLKEEKLEKDYESNFSCLLLEIISSNKKIQGLYALFESMPIERYIVNNGKSYKLELRHVRTYLPFSVKLIDFIKKSYLGIDLAKSYESKVSIIDKDISWNAVIQMNHPLRYKGYIFYQSSFIRDGDKELTVLAVVKNYSYIIPYISSIILCIGLLIHIFQRVRSLNNSR